MTEVALASARGVPALAEEARAWAQGERETGEALALLLNERAVEREAPGLARLADEVAFLTLATAREREASPFSRAMVSRIGELMEALDRASLPADTLVRLRRLVLAWQAWAGGAGGLASAFAEAHLIVRDLLLDLGPEPVARATPQDEPTAADLDPEPDGPAAQEPALSLGRVVLPALPLGATREARQALEAFKGIEGVPLPLTPVPDLVEVRTRLLTQLPHWERILDRLLLQAGARPHVQLQVLLLGPPGAAKTFGARLVLEALGVQHRVIDCASLSDAMVLGSSRKWSNGAPGAHWDLILAHHTASPGLIFDEVEKAGGSERHGDVRRTLLALLEPQRAAALLDPYLEVPVDLSGLSTVLTANALRGLSRPLLDRVEVLEVPAPGREHLDALAGSLLRSLAREQTGDARWAWPLEAHELALLARHWRGGSLRILQRLVRQVIASRERFATRH
jgi:hypothetical protein